MIVPKSHHSAKKSAKSCGTVTGPRPRGSGSVTLATWRVANFERRR